MTEMVVAEAGLDRAALLERWRQGDTLSFKGATGVDQSWIDDVTGDGSLRNVRFAACEFVGGISFAGVTFVGDFVTFRECVFPADVSFDGCCLSPGGVQMDLIRIQVGRNFSFRDVDLDGRTFDMRGASFAGDCCLEQTTFGVHANLGARYAGPVSLRQARLASSQTEFRSARFEGPLDMSGAYLAEGSTLVFAESEWPVEESVTLDDFVLHGRLVLHDAVPLRIAALLAPPEVGTSSPLRNELRVEFTVGRLEGRSYRVPSVAHLCELLERVGPSQAVVSREDVDFSIAVAFTVNGFAAGQTDTPAGVVLQPITKSDMESAILRLSAPD